MSRITIGILPMVWLVACIQPPAQPTLTPLATTSTPILPTATSLAIRGSATTNTVVAISTPTPPTSAATLDPADCPSTPFSKDLPPDENTASFTPTWYRNPEGTLWAGLAPQFEGHWYGGVGHKILWWRGRPGDLQVVALRRDARAEVHHVDIPDGYGDQGYQADGVYIPTAGCWEIVGWTRSDELHFTIYAQLLEADEIDCIMRNGFIPERCLKHR